MPCPAITTGSGFLIETLSHLDCQAQVIGSYGFGALADPSSPAQIVLTAMLTLFVALFGVRLLFGDGVGARDVIDGVLKVGIVLTLALSWPAFETVAYDTVLFGPAEIAATIYGQANSGPTGQLEQRLQNVDNGLVELTALGTGRQTGQLQVPGEQAGSFAGEAIGDETGFGWGRTVYLGGTIGPLGALRIAAGLLLAIAPLMAGLLLFEATRGIFAGWLRGLALTALGSLGITLLLSVEGAALESWLAGTLARRTAGYATPDAPTELLALALGFAIAGFLLLGILTRVAFQNSSAAANWLSVWRSASRTQRARVLQPATGLNETSEQSRAWAVSRGVRSTMRHESFRFEQQGERRVMEAMSREGGVGRPASARAEEPLGNSYRRTARRVSRSGQARDRKP